MVKRKNGSDPHDNLRDLQNLFVGDLQDHFLALREAFSALTHTLLQQGQLDVQVFQSHLGTAEQVLRDNAESKAAEALNAFALALTTDLALARRDYVRAARAQQQSQPPEDM